MNYLKKTYYAHSMHLYSTDTEKSERQALEKMGFNIICPSRDLKLGNDMDAYLRIVKQCKRLICSEYSGFIGKGVYLEIKVALANNIPSYVLRDGFLYRIFKINVFNTDDWKTTVGKITGVELVTENILDHAPINN